MSYLVWPRSIITGLSAVCYILLLYSLESADFIFTHAFALGALLSFAMTLLWHYAPLFSSTATLHFVSAFSQFVLVIAGVMISTMVIAGAESRYQAMLHCAAISPLGLSLLAIKVNTTRQQRKGEIMTLILLNVSAVLPFIIIIALAAHISCRMSKPEFFKTPCFLSKPDLLAGMVCNVFFTMSLLHGFFISISFVFNEGLPSGIPTPAFFAVYHIAAFATALIILFVVRKAVTHIALLFYLAASPAAVFPGYVLLILIYLIAAEQNSQPIADSNLAS